jgi:hypothetical protein
MQTMMQRNNQFPKQHLKNGVLKNNDPLADLKD